MGLLDFLKKLSAPNITEADLILPERVKASNANVFLSKQVGTRQVEIHIVGESHRQENVLAVANVAQGSEFDLWLIPEPANKFDKNAVKVMVGNLHVGYVSADSAKYWIKMYRDLLKENRLLWGRGTVRGGNGAPAGVRGFAWTNEKVFEAEKIASKQLTDEDLEKLLNKLIDLYENSYPETLAQAKSRVRKIVKECEKLIAHIAFLADTDALEHLDKWQEVSGFIDDLIQIYDDLNTYTDIDDLDAEWEIEALIDALKATTS